MPYHYSQIDRNNIGWFTNDVTRSTLLAIRIDVGSIRGLQDLEINFQYPITAIAGRNGSGKTTLLSLAACAFHAPRRGYKLKGRKNPYYTISDFLSRHRMKCHLRVFVSSTKSFITGGLSQEITLIEKVRDGNLEQKSAGEGGQITIAV
jgi:predicted ATPase